eukprot:351563-Chlamydomonas_euryale.AAC.8
MLSESLHKIVLQTGELEFSKARLRASACKHSETRPGTLHRLFWTQKLPNLLPARHTPRRPAFAGA